jgi:hypothetical protein
MSIQSKPGLRRHGVLLFQTLVTAMWLFVGYIIGSLHGYKPAYRAGYDRGAQECQGILDEMYQNLYK